MMKKILFTFLPAAFLLTGFKSFSQNSRIKEYNNIGWFNYFGTFKIGAKTSLHTEYQWRRDNYITHDLQNLRRIGINYQVHPKAEIRLGYAWIETFVYGDIPLNSLGKNFTEHRTYQMATITDKIARLALSHRFLFEQRWVGRYSDASLAKEDDYVFSNRLRYMLRLQLPLKKGDSKNGMPYLALYDEVLIAFGNNVGEDIFNQNRVGLLAGYQFNKTFKMEAGYINQIIQYGREINNSSIFQHNNGFLINAIFNVDLRKKGLTGN